MHGLAVRVVKIQAIFLQHFHDSVGMGDLSFAEHATNDRLAYLVVTFLIEIDFVDGPAGGDNQYLFQGFGLNFLEKPPKILKVL